MESLRLKINSTDQLASAMSISFKQALKIREKMIKAATKPQRAK